MKTAVAAINLGHDILNRLDSVAAAEMRSRSNQARIFLEAALNADEALRRQAEAHFESLQMPGGGVFPHAARGAPLSSSRGGAAQEVVGSHLPDQAGAVEATVFAGDPPPAPASFLFTQGHVMTDNQAEHKRLQEQALRDAIAQDAACREAAQKSPLFRAAPKGDGK